MDGKRDLKGTGYEVVDWIHMAQFRDQWRQWTFVSVKDEEFLDRLCDYQFFKKCCGQWNELILHLGLQTGMIPWVFPIEMIYEGVSKSFRTGLLERKLQIVQLSATRCSYIAILWVTLVSFATITLYVASERVFIVVSIYFVMTQSGNFWILPRISLSLLTL
jgi:hypothetical protein